MAKEIKVKKTLCYSFELRNADHLSAQTNNRQRSASSEQVLVGQSQLRDNAYKPLGDPVRKSLNSLQY